jgi:hypothetical protein
MPRKPEQDRPDERRDETPATDLPPRREPYYEGYFGTEEEEGAVREEESGDTPRPRHGEEAAGGDREISEG